MFEYASLIDVYEMKLIIFAISVAVAIWLGNKFIDRRNKDD